MNSFEKWKREQKFKNMPLSCGERFLFAGVIGIALLTLFVLGYLLSHL